jgi:branched-chain amino acid transport system permease protein
MQPKFAQSFRFSLIGGLSAILVSLLGMVEAFNDRDIIVEIISMGQLLLVLVAFLTAYSTTQKAETEEHLKGFQAVLHGTLAGFVVMALLAVLAILIKEIDMRDILVNASPQLIQILTFGSENIVIGVLILLILGAVIGAAAGLLYIAPPTIKKAITTGLIWVMVLGTLQDLLRVALSTSIGFLFTWMWGRAGQTGLSIVGVLVVFILSAGVSYFWHSRDINIQRYVQTLPSLQQRNVRWGAWALAGILILILPQILGTYLSEVANQVGLFILMGLGLNIVVGFAGLLDLGYVAFFAIGAYIVGVLTSTGGELVTAFQWSFWAALPFAVIMSIVAGIVLGIPVLKIRGDYLAIVTLGFGEIIRIMALSDFLKPYIGGSQGIVEVAKPMLGSYALGNSQNLFYLILICCFIAAFVAYRLRDSRMGRMWMAMREDEDVAQAMGIHLISTKLMAFATGAAFSGLSGAIFASKLGTIYPHSFALLISINVLALIIIGGMGSIPGVIVGSLVLVGLPELLREFAEYRLLVYGAALVMMMLYRPEGLWPAETNQRELHGEEAAVEA